MYDIIAIGGFTTSIFLLYLSYSQFCRLSDTIGFSDSLHLMTSIQYKYDNISFLTYAANSLTTITFGFIERRRQYLTNAIHDMVMNSLPDFTNQALEICVNQKREGLVGVVPSIIRTLVAPEITNICISKITQINIENILHAQQQQIRILIAQLDTDISQIRSIITYALHIGYTSTAYLSWRITSISKNHFLDSDILTILSKNSNS